MSSFVYSSAMRRTLRCGVFVTILTFLTLSQFEVSTAKAFGLRDGYWSTDDGISKRNSWWSKKSLESAPDYQRLLRDSAFTDSAIDSTADSVTSDISSLYRCYVQTCVPDYIECSKRSRQGGEAHSCKAGHRLCALQCWVENTENRRF